MAGPKIMWDAHNYLALDVRVGPSWFDENEMTEQDRLAAETELKEKLGDDAGMLIDWSDDPVEFAESLERVAAQLRKVAAAGLTEGHFHIRTDID